MLYTSSHALCLCISVLAAHAIPVALSVFLRVQLALPSPALANWGGRTFVATSVSATWTSEAAPFNLIPVLIRGVQEALVGTDSGFNPPCAEPIRQVLLLRLAMAVEASPRDPVCSVDLDTRREPLHQITDVDLYRKSGCNTFHYSLPQR